MDLENKIEAQRKRMEQEKNKLDMLMKKAKAEQRKADNHRKIVVGANIPMAEKAANKGQDKGIRKYADAPAERVSLKERLAEMKVKAAGNNVKKSVEKEKNREDIL